MLANRFLEACLDIFKKLSLNFFKFIFLPKNFLVLLENIILSLEGMLIDFKSRSAYFAGRFNCFPQLVQFSDFLIEFVCFSCHHLSVFLNHFIEFKRLILCNSFYGSTVERKLIFNA